MSLDDRTTDVIKKLRAEEAQWEADIGRFSEFWVFEPTIAELERLSTWKTEATEVIEGWDAVYDALEHKGDLGRRKSDIVLAELTRLQGLVAQWEEWFQDCTSFTPRSDSDATDCAYCCKPRDKHPRMIEGYIYSADLEPIPDDHPVEWLRGQIRMGVAVPLGSLRGVLIGSTTRVRLAPRS